MDRILARITSVALLLAATVSEGQQGADYGPLPYDYITTNLVLTELDETGVEIGASFEVANRVHIFADYRDYEVDSGSDRTTLQLGGAYRWDLQPNLDLLAKIAFADNETDGPGSDESSDEGLVASALLRGWVSRVLELSGELILDDSLGSDLETVVEFGGQYFLRSNLSVGGRIRVDEDDTSVLLGARFYFGAAARRPLR